MYADRDWWIDDDGCIASGKDDDYVTIAQVLNYQDAPLIAAAPKLLEACKKLHSCLLAACSYPECADVAKHWRIDLGQAEAAIASAESQK